MEVSSQHLPILFLLQMFILPILTHLLKEEQTKNRTLCFAVFFPKNKSLENISDQAIKAAQDWINTFPRKIFDYSCSNDLFQRFVNYF